MHARGLRLLAKTESASTTFLILRRTTYQPLTCVRTPRYRWLHSLIAASFLRVLAL